SPRKIACQPFDRSGTRSGGAPVSGDAQTIVPFIPPISSYGRVFHRPRFIRGDRAFPGRNRSISEMRVAFAAFAQASADTPAHGGRECATTSCGAAPGPPLRGGAPGCTAPAGDAGDPSAPVVVDRQ